MDTNYDITKDPYYQDYISNNPRISENTIIRYKRALIKFSTALGLTLEEIVTTCKDEQDIQIEEIINVAEDENGNKITRKRVTHFDVNGKDSTIKNYFAKYVKYCQEKGNKNSTINSEAEAIRTVLLGCGVRLPTLKELEDDSDKWNLLTKDDFNYALQDASLVHLSLAHFLVGTGMRVGDALKLTIGDFMEATKEYHNFVDVEDFVDNAPDDMIGTYIFHPTKTRRYGIKCVTFNSAESSNIILQNLRHIKNVYYPAKEKETGLKLKMSKKDALFGSKKGKFKTAMKPKTIAEQWGKKNKKLSIWKINQIKQKIADGELSEEDYDKEVEKIPRFHAHACRKYFQSTISRNCGDVRICALMEGHKPPLKTDKSYIKKSTEDVKEIYLKAHDDLTLSKIETRIVSDKETERLNQALAEANAKVEDLEQKLADKDEEIIKIQTSVNNMQKQVNDLGRITPSRKTKSDIEKAINMYCKNNLNEDDMQKDYVIRNFALDLALENKKDFENTDDYISPLIKKAKIKINLSGKSIEELFNQIMVKNDEEYIGNKEMTNAVREVMKTMTSNSELMEIISDENYYELQDAIETYLKKSDYDITNLSDSDKTEIVSEVLMEFV